MVTINNNISNNKVFRNAVEFAHDIIKRKIQKGDVVVDATVGNGNDTALLAHLVGNAGMVYGFDIQKKAIEKTKDRLIALDLSEKVTLINDSHEMLDKYIKEEIDLVIFNLGYLPSGDHEITTESKSTLISIHKSTERLKKFGLIIVVIYSGHAKGMQEKLEIEKFTTKLNQKEFNVVKINFSNQMNNPPSIVIIEKK